MNPKVGEWWYVNTIIEVVDRNGKVISSEDKIQLRQVVGLHSEGKYLIQGEHNVYVASRHNLIYREEPMKVFGLVCAGICTVVGVTLLTLIVYATGVLNHEASLRVQFKAQQSVNESSFDKTWKVISQQANIAEHERDDFRKTYVEIMEATRGVAGNGQLASFFTQAKVDVPPDLFAKLMTTIESQRESFHRDQQKLLQLQAEQNKCFEVQPSGLILSLLGRTERVKANIVTSSKTSEAFESGEDNNTELFSK